MSLEANISPPPPETPALAVEARRQEVRFSGSRWFFTGIARLLYRRWTRIAVRLFPEESKAERLAHKLHIPLPDQLNLDWVTDQLAVGGRVHPDDIPALARVGITHVIDTRSEHCDDVAAMTREHIQLLYLPAKDTYPLTVDQLLEGARWAAEHMQQGGRVLIHCEHGVGRSVLLTCSVLVYSGLSAHEALRLVQQKRWQAAPNHRQIQRLREFESARQEQATPAPGL
ncbi:MAG TPA: dual specificity protein phosphatase [Ktedonobacteraceae bacterium]